MRPALWRWRQERRERRSRERERGASGDADVLRLFTLPAGADVELDVLTFLQGAIPAALDRREVDEHIGSVLARDEAVALLRVEPFHGACCQRLAPYRLRKVGRAERRPTCADAH